jgi:hypothetical protein
MIGYPVGICLFLRTCLGNPLSVASYTFKVVGVTLLREVVEIWQ